MGKRAHSPEIFDGSTIAKVQYQTFLSWVPMLDISFSFQFISAFNRLKSRQYMKRSFMNLKKSTLQKINIFTDRLLSRL